MNDGGKHSVGMVVLKKYNICRLPAKLWYLAIWWCLMKNIFCIQRLYSIVCDNNTRVTNIHTAQAQTHEAEPSCTGWFSAEQSLPLVHKPISYLTIVECNARL